MKFAINAPELTQVFTLGPGSSDVAQLGQG